MPKIIDDATRIVAEKIVDLISDCNDEVRQNLAQIIAKVNDRYSNTWTGLIAKTFGYRTRGNILTSAKDDLGNKEYKEQLLQMQTFLKLIEGGGTKPSSANTRLFKLLTAKMKDYEHDVSLDIPDVIKSLYTNIVDVLDKKIKDCEKKIKEADANKANLTEKRKVQGRNLDDVMVFDKANEAINYQKENPEKVVFWLSQLQTKKSSIWQLFWLDQLNHFNYIKTDHKFIELFESIKNGEYLQVGTVLYEQVKTLSYDLLQKSKTGEIYLFSEASEARQFAAQNPQKNSLYFRSYSPEAPALGYTIEVFSAKEKLKQRTIYLQSEGKDVIRYTLLDGKTTKPVSAVIQRHQIETTSLFDDLYQNKPDVDLQSYQEQLIKITEAKGHTETKPESCQFGWYDNEGRMTNIDLAFPGKKLGENNQLPAADDAKSGVLKDYLHLAINNLIDKVPVVINPEKEMLLQAIELLFSKACVKIATMEAGSVNQGVMTYEKNNLIQAVNGRINELPIFSESQKSSLAEAISVQIQKVKEINRAKSDECLDSIRKLIMSRIENNSEKDSAELEIFSMVEPAALAVEIPKTEKSYMPALLNTFVIRTNPLSVNWYDAHSTKYPVDLDKNPALIQLIGDNLTPVPTRELKAYLRNIGFRKDVDQGKQQQVKTLLNKLPTLIITENLAELPRFKLRDNTYFLTREAKKWVLYHRENKTNHPINTPEWPFNRRLLTKLEPFNDKKLAEITKQSAVVLGIQILLTDHEKALNEKLKPAVCQQNDAFSADDTSIYLPDSFVISKQKADWRLHYIDSEFSAEVVASKKVTGLPELLEQLDEQVLSPDSLQQLGRVLCHYNRKVSSRQEELVNVAFCLQDNQFSTESCMKYKKDSFVVSRQEEVRTLHYIDSTHRPKIVDSSQIKRIKELFLQCEKENELSPQQLQQLGILLFNYKAHMESYAALGRLSMFSPKESIVVAVEKLDSSRYNAVTKIYGGGEPVNAPLPEELASQPTIPM